MSSIISSIQAHPVIYTLIMTHITIASVTIFLHRSQAHQSVILHPIISHFFRFWLWITTGMVTKEWVAIHRKHHAKCETEEDPHSPIYKGIWYILFFGVVPYKQEAKNQETLDNYGKGTPDDKLENFYSKGSAYGILVMLCIDLYLFGMLGLLIWFVQMYWIPFTAAGVINGIGHYIGYRTFSAKDTSTNIIPLGLIIGGEELHNNHHAFPRSAKLSFRWFEFDIGWFYINLLKVLGLAKITEVAPKAETAGSSYRFESKLAYFSNKMRSTRIYEKRVLNVILQENIDSISKKIGENLSFSKVSSMLATNRSILKSNWKASLEKIISSDDSLKKVYELKQSFEDVWKGVGLSLAERKEKFEDWCKEAQSLSIACVDDFVNYIKIKMQLQAS